jgi:catechol 2,3-dioxygenase-like lactoylglutathione lyase family enzyme
MQLERIDHYTIRSTASELESLREFYVGVLGLEPGPRPDFSFPGVWLYSHGHPVVHLAALEPESSSPRPAATVGRPVTGSLDHIAFKAAGLTATRARLAERGLSWEERPVPGFPLHQVFLRDPLGLQIELTFDAAEARG